MATHHLLLAALFCRLLEGKRLARHTLDIVNETGVFERHGTLHAEVEEAQAQAETQAGLPSCAGGSMELTGRYEVREEVTIQGPCRVTGSAELDLGVPLRFQGNVSIFGQLAVTSWRDLEGMEGPCVTVHGSLHLHPAARLLFDCPHRVTKGSSPGGALAVDGDADLLGGHLLFRNCKLLNRAEVLSRRLQSLGGALHVGGVLRNQGATVEATGCAATHGGAIYAREVHLLRGAILIRETAASNGGAINANTINIFGGNLTVLQSSAENFGGALAAKSIRVFDGALTIRNAIAKEDGGAIYASEVDVSGGRLAFDQPMAFYNGGAMYVKEEINVSGGHLAIVASKASQGLGGAIHAGKMRMSDGAVDLDARAGKAGGVIWADRVEVLGGDLRLRGLASMGDGGALLAKMLLMSGGNLTVQASQGQRGGAIYSDEIHVSGGDLTLRGCQAGNEGGSIFAGLLLVWGGNLRVQNSGGHYGGALFVHKLEMSEGNVTIIDSQAGKKGGGIYATDILLSGGNLTILKSTARSGGAVYAFHCVRVEGGHFAILISESWGASGGAIWAYQLDVSGGEVRVHNSTAYDDGGAVFVRSLSVWGGELVVQDASAGGAGGCIFVYHGRVSSGVFNQSGGLVDLRGCRASECGGALHAAQVDKAAAAQLTVRHSEAGRGAGICALQNSDIQAKNLRVYNCSAKSYGGCFFFRDGARFRGPLSLEDCRAKGSGGAIWGQGRLQVERLRCLGCHAPVAAVLHTEDGSARLGKVEVANPRRQALTSTLAADSNSTIAIASLDCLFARSCSVTGRAQVGRLRCQRGEGRQLLGTGEGIDDIDGVACQTCPVGKTRLVMLDEARCTPCPRVGNLSIFCTATELELPPGYMVDVNRAEAIDFSNWYRCPSELACPGGHLNASSRPGIPVQELVPMCAEGYSGSGCVDCAVGYARADSDILQCVRCAKWSSSPGKVALYVFFVLLKSLGLFAFAVFSVKRSTRKSRRASSSALLNQLMSFAAVAGITMSGAMQTVTFKEDLHSAAQVAFRLFSLPVSVAQGEAGASGGMSGECLLEQLGVVKDLPHTHAVMSLWPALLVVVLAIVKGGWLAVVVGVNVFLPAFVAGFGKYLVSFRLRPESYLDIGDLRWYFLPPDPHTTSYLGLRISLVALVIIGLVAASAGSWIYVVRSRKAEVLQAHVSYLVQSYRPECAAWEVERLVRKVALALITAMLPVTLSPALQMEAVTLVLIVSLAAYLCCWPYHVDFWNRVEVGLLIAGLTITGLTTCLIANDLHWAHSTLMQRVLVCLICSTAGGISMAMMGACFMAYYEERLERREKAPTEEEEEA